MRITGTCKTISYASIEERDEKAAKLIKLHEKRSWLKRKFSFVDYEKKLEIEDQLRCLNREIARI